MIPRHFAINLAFLQGFVGLVFLPFFIIESQEALSRALGDGPPVGLHFVEVVGFFFIYGVALLAIMLAVFMTSPLTRTTLVLSSLQLVGSVALLFVTKGILLGLTAFLVIPVAIASIALSIYRRREQVRVSKSSALVPHGTPGSQTRLTTVIIIVLQSGIALGLLIYALIQVSHNNQEDHFEGIISISLAVLVYILTPALFSIGIVALLLGRYASRAWHLAIPQFILSLPIALAFLIHSDAGSVVAGLALVVIPMATLSLTPRTDSATLSPDLTAPLDLQHTAALRAQREREAATWESPSVWTSRYFSFQISVYTIACAQILLSIIIIFLWYHLVNETTRAAYRDRDFHFGPEDAWLDPFILLGVLTLATGCMLLSPWARVTIGLAGLQTALALGFLIPGTQFHTIPAIIVPLALLSLAIALWRRRISPPEIAT